MKKDLGMNPIYEYLDDPIYEYSYRACLRAWLEDPIYEYSYRLAWKILQACLDDLIYEYSYRACLEDPTGLLGRSYL